MFRHCFAHVVRGAFNSRLILPRVSGSVQNVRYLIVPISCDAIQPFAAGNAKRPVAFYNEKCFGELFNDSRSARSNYLRGPQVIPGVKTERDWTMGRFLSHCDASYAISRNFAKSSSAFAIDSIRRQVL